MWYILTWKPHKLWELDGVIITPDFEVFIPYLFDPLVIDMLNHFGDSLNMKITCSEVKVKGNVKMSKGRRVQMKLKRVCIGYGNDYFFVYNIENCKNKDDDDLRMKVLADAFHMIRTAAVPMHPIAPEGTEMILDYLRLGEEFWS